MTTAQITASQVKELREATGAGMMDAKKALVETSGDFDAAVTLLREKGIAKAGKLGARETTEGRIGVATSGSKAAIVKIGCNTDFVAKNDDFGVFVQKIADHVLANEPADVEALLAQEWAEGGTVENARAEASATTGENIAILDLKLVDAGNGIIGSYLHGTLTGVLVAVDGPDNEKVHTFANDVAMQVVAASPQYLTRNEVPEAAIEAERDIYLKQVEDKPENIRAKIADGKIDKWFGEQALVEQTWVFGKDRVGKDVTIAEYAKMTSDEVGAPVEVKSFVRFAIKG